MISGINWLYLSCHPSKLTNNCTSHPFLRIPIIYSTFSSLAKYCFQGIYNFFSCFIIQGLNPELSWQYIYDNKEIRVITKLPNSDIWQHRLPWICLTRRLNQHQIDHLSHRQWLLHVYMKDEQAFADCNYLDFVTIYGQCVVQRMCFPRILKLCIVCQNLQVH
jgi:hypothetical protein